MNSVNHCLRIILIPLAACLLIGAAPSDYSKLVVAGKVAISTMESSQDKLADILLPLIDMMDNGVEAVSRDYWDENVAPVLLQVDKELAALPDLLKSVLPSNFKISSNDPKNEPWITVYSLSCSLNYIDLRGMNDLFDCEYCMLLMGASSYIQMYVGSIYSRYESLGRYIELLQTIIDDPEDFRKEKIELQQREKKEIAEKKKTEEKEKKQNALRKEPIVPNHSLDSYQSPFSFIGIPLGLEFQDCVIRFKARGFKVEKQETEKTIFYGFTPSALLSGTYDAHPVTIKINASSKSYRVYEMTVTIKQVLDEYEADDLMNNIATQFAFTHPNFTVDPQNGTQSVSLTKSLDETGRLFNKMGIPSLGVRLRDYYIKGDNSSYSGMISLCRVMTDPGCCIDYRLYDHKIGMIAQDETK